MNITCAINGWHYAKQSLSTLVVNIETKSVRMNPARSYCAPRGRHWSDNRPPHEASTPQVVSDVAKVTQCLRSPTKPISNITQQSCYLAAFIHIRNKGQRPAPCQPGFYRVSLPLLQLVYYTASKHRNAAAPNITIGSSPHSPPMSALCVNQVFLRLLLVFCGHVRSCLAL
jgi:hypothetical protein